METIGFIGLGNMGGNMAARYLAAGYTVYGEARDRTPAQWLIDQGLQWVDTPRQVAEAADIVMTSLPNDVVVESVAAGPDGLLVGQGLVLKLAINISLAVQMLAFSEGLLLAERDRIDSHRAAEVMAESAIGSPMLKARLPLVLDRPDETWFDVSLMHKDIRLALATAYDQHVVLPSARVADQVLSEATEHSYAHRDIAVLHELLTHDLTPAISTSRDQVRSQLGGRGRRDVRVPAGRPRPAQATDAAVRRDSAAWVIKPATAPGWET